MKNCESKYSIEKRHPIGREKMLADPIWGASIQDVQRTPATRQQKANQFRRGKVG